MIWFTSDTHFGHTNIAGAKCSKWKGGYRDFDSVEEMNIVKTINKYVKWDDVLYHLGDFCFGGHRNTPRWRERLNVNTIHLTRGNHDGHIDLYKDCFTSIQDVLTISEGIPNTIFMSHYSHRVWLGSHKGNIHLYGHSHGSIPDYGRSMDCGIDVAKKMFGEYRPFSIDEIMKIMRNKEEAFPDHHSKETNTR